MPHCCQTLGMMGDQIMYNTMMLICIQNVHTEGVRILTGIAYLNKNEENVGSFWCAFLNCIGDFILSMSLKFCKYVYLKQKTY